MWGVLYKEREFWGKHWVAGDWLNEREPTLIARFPKDPPDGDGYDVDVYCAAYPARFYAIKALPSSIDPGGEVRPGFTLSTGSSMERLAYDVAEAIAQGMLDIS